MSQDNSASPEMASGAQMDSRDTINEISLMTDDDFLSRGFGKLVLQTEDFENNGNVVSGSLVNINNSYFFLFTF